MKLAEALQERADLNRRIEQLENRLCNNAIVQEGERPAEDPQDLLDELDRDMDRLEELTAAINLTNCRTLYEGESLTALIARRDCLRLRLGILRDFIDHASQTTRRARGSEIRVLSTVNVRNMQRETDELSRDLRLLDNAIQATNWVTEL
ncbi:MAG: DIP1984 family protein [Clostridia bacterium]|nr:DIP1984 family protein [Clostridia bacterium]